MHMKKKKVLMAFILLIIFFLGMLLINKDYLFEKVQNTINYLQLSSDRQELYNKLEITEVSIKSRKTGTAPFSGTSTSDLNGNDISATDNYVRTSDKILYTLEFAINYNTNDNTNIDTSLTGGVVKVKATLPNQGENPNLTWDQDAWMQNVTFNEDHTEITAEFVSTTETMANAMKNLSFTVLVGGYKTTITSDMLPVFEIWMEGNQPDNISSTAESVKTKDTNSILISGTPSYNVVLVPEYDTLLKTTKNINGVEMPGRYKNVSVGVALRKLDGMPDYRGVEYPAGEFNVDLNLKYYYSIGNTGTHTYLTSSTSGAIDALNGTTIQAYAANGELNENHIPNNDTTATVDRLPYGRLSLGDTTDSVVDSGTVTASLSGSTLSVNFKDYKVGNSFPIYPSNHVSIDDFNRENAFFLSGIVELFVPFYGDQTTDNSYYLEITADSAEYTLSDGSTGVINSNGTSIADKDTTDNVYQLDFDNYLNYAYIYSMYTYTPQWENLETTGKHYGDASVQIGSNFNVTYTHGMMDGEFEGGMSTLIAWDASMIGIRAINGTTWYYVSTSSYTDYLPETDNITVTYGIYKDNAANGLTTLDEINAAIYSDFTWYSTYDEAAANGVVTAIYIDDPDMKGNQASRRYNTYYTLLNKPEKVGKTAVIRGKVYAYEDAERTTRASYRTSAYYPTTYDEKGRITSYENDWGLGKTILATSNTSSVTINSYQEDELQDTFDIRNGKVTYKVTPTITTNITDLEAIDKTYIYITLPKGLKYYDGSSNKTPESIIENEDGTTLITYLYENWYANEEPPEYSQIIFDAEISSDSANNTIYSTTAVIANSGDLRDEQIYRTATSSIKIVNLSGVQLNQSIDNKIIELGQSVVSTIQITNSSSTDIEDVRTTEILPNTSTGVKGKYTITITSLDTNQKMYYSTAAIDTLGLVYENNRYNAQSVDLTTSNWIEVNVGSTIPNNATIIISQFDKISVSEKKTYSYKINTTNAHSGDNYVFTTNLSSDGSNIILQNNTLSFSVINRKIEGNIVPANENTELLDNINVYLLDENKTIIDSTTSENNKYSFDSLKQGSYYVKFDFPNYYEVSNTLSNTVDSTGTSHLITEHNTDATEPEVKVENIDIVLARKTATLTVHHYIEGTTTELAASSIETLLWGNQYTTTPATVDSNYELVNTPSNATGTVTGNTTVIYYYKLKTATITVHHYIKGTTDKLADDVVTTQNYTTTYSTKAASVDSKYELVETPSNASGTVSGNVTVTYYYQLKTATLTVNHYVQGTTTKLSDTVTKTMNWGEEYTTSVATDISENYELVSTPSNSSGTIAGDVTVNYYYKLKEGTLTIHYYVEGTTTKLSNSITKSVHWGDKYETSPATDINENYELVSTPSNATGTISANETIVIYYYQLKTATLTVNYYIEGTTTKLSNTLTETMNWGETYTTSSASDISENYKLVSTPTNSTGTIKGDVTVNYYYRLKEAKVTVNYYIEGTTTKLADSIIQELNWGDEYETSPSPDVSNNYELVSTPSNATGTIKDDAIVVNYYYRLKEAKLTVHHYIEGTTEKLTDSETSTIYWGDQYTTEQSAKVSSNYEIVSIPSNATGTVSGDVTVIYYYRLKTATITVYHYIDGTTTRIADSVSFTKKYTEEYTTNPATDIDSNYELAGTPSNANGTVSGNITIIYYYKLKTATLTVHHYIEGTTTSLIADEISTVTYTHTYQTSQLKENNILKNYELASTQGTLQGTVSGNIEVTYYYKLKSSTLVVKHLEYGTNKELVPHETKTLKYTDEYETSVSTSVPGNYEYYSKTDNYKGIVATDTIEVIYYYQEKDSQLSSSIRLTLPEEITTKTQKVNYKLEYTSTINDYRGSGTTTIIVQLPYHIDESKSNLNGGTYNSDLKTITWITTEEDINATSEQKVISGNKDFSVTFSDLVSTDRTMNTSVTSHIKLENNETNAEDNQTTYIKIQGKIIVHHYVEGTTTKVVDDIETTNLVGETYVSESVEKKGYLLKKEPENKNHIYQDETQEIIYEYERLKFNIITKVDGGEGTIGGDETVFYGDNSTEGNIVIKPNKGYQVSHIIVNGEEKNITQCKNGCILNNFVDVQEDKEIVVIFEVIPDNPNTSSIITIFTITGLTVLSTGAYILIKKYKPSIKKI